MNSNNLIYVMESDRRLNDNLQRSLSRSFPDRKIINFYSNRDLLTAIKKRRPCVLLLSCVREQDDIDFQDIIEAIKQDKLVNQVSCILMGTRQELEHFTDFVLEHELQTIPKAIRMPVLLDMVEGAFARADLNKISFLQLAAGEYLFKQGERADSVYVLKSGKLAVEMVAKDKKIRLKEIGPEEMLGEMAFVDNSPRSASALAILPCEVIKLELGDFKEYLDKQSVWVRLIIETLNQRLREANLKLIKN